MDKDKKISQKEKLKKAGIREFEELIHDQSKDWILHHFSKGATKNPVNISRLMRNMIWQMRQRIRRKEKEPFAELIRTYRYMYIKPTLSRVGSLSHEVDQYEQLIDTLVYMVKEIDLIRYKDIGFSDDNKANLSIGEHGNIILFAEKVGHVNFLQELHKKYQISVIALGGQPSLMNIEYFVDALKEKKIHLGKSFYVFSIVDYDPSGWIIRDAFMNNLRFYGIKNIQVVDLINPDMLTKEELLLSRYEILHPESMLGKNKKWLKEIQTREYKNQQHLIEMPRERGFFDFFGPPPKEDPTHFGLQAEAVSTKRITKKLEEIMVPLLGKNEELLKRYELKLMNEALKKLILHKV